MALNNKYLHTVYSHSIIRLPPYIPICRQLIKFRVSYLLFLYEGYNVADSLLVCQQITFNAFLPVFLRGQEKDIRFLICLIGYCLPEVFLIRVADDNSPFVAGL